MLYLEAYDTSKCSRFIISVRDDYSKENIISDIIGFCKSDDDYINKEYIPAIADKLVEDRKLYSGWVALWDFVFGVYMRNKN